MTSNKALNSNDALEESTAASSSVILSGARRVKEAPDGLDIEEHTTNPQNSDPGEAQKAEVGGRRYATANPSFGGSGGSRRCYVLRYLLRLSYGESRKLRRAIGHGVPRRSEILRHGGTWLLDLMNWPMIACAFSMTGALEKNAKPPGPSRFAEASLVALVALALFALTFSLAISKGLHRDEHQHVAAGALLARDSLLPYKDYAFFHMPYLPFIYSGIFTLCDHLLFSARLFSILCATAAGVVIFSVSRRIFHERAGGLLVPLGAIVLFATASQFTHTTAQAWNQEPATLCALLFFLAYVAGFHSPRPGRWAFAAGLLLGLGIGIRITLAPLGGALILMLAWFPPTSRDRPRFFGLAALGLTLALLPAFILFLQAPEQFLFGNLEFVKVNDLFRQNTHDVMTLVKKLHYTVRQIVMNLPLFNAFVGATIIALLHARASRLPLPRETKVLFVTLPFLLMGALAPSPVYSQYFYPLLPFLVLGGVYAVAAVADSTIWWRRSIFFGAAGVIASMILAMSSYRHLRELFSPHEWAPLQIHDRAVQMCAPVPRGGRVLTLGPSWPLEAKLPI